MQKIKKDLHSDDDEVWNEIPDGECPGAADTMLTDSTFIENAERDYIFNFAPGEGSKPISIFLEPHSEEKCFPGIYCGQRRATNEERICKVTYGEIVKSELRNVDRRAACCVENIFFKTEALQMKTIQDQSCVALRKVKVTNKVTAKDVRGDKISELIHHDKAYKCLAKVRGSPPYFEQVSKDLKAMIRQLGPATLFLTLSAAETQWTDLLKMLGKINEGKVYSDEDIENMTWLDKCKLINQDPVTCARHFDSRVSHFVNIFIKSDNFILPGVTDYFYRVEFQQRGSPHIHMMIWMKNTPRYGIQSNEEICHFVDSLISCESGTANSDLNTHVINLQQHRYRHSHTCRKNNQNVCRFHFPRYVMPETVLLEPFDENERENLKVKYQADVERIKLLLDDANLYDLETFEQLLEVLGMSFDLYLNAIKSTLNVPTIFLKRNTTDTRVNNYNPHLLLAWQANIDIQFVLDTHVQPILPHMLLKVSVV